MGKTIFIAGNSRSGTTMMGRILGNHDLIFTFNELHFFGEIIQSENLDKNLTLEESLNIFANLVSIQRDGYLSKRKPEKYISESREVVTDIKGNNGLTPILIFKKFLQYETLKNQKVIACEQTPQNLYYLQEIEDRFSEPRIINMIRDPRDVLLSQKKKWKRRFLGAKNIPLIEALRAWANYHPYIICKLWCASIRRSDSFSRSSNILTVYFENLLMDPETEVKRICDFLDIKFSHSMLSIPQIGSSSNADNFKAKGIRTDRVSSWKNGGLTKSELYFCNKLCSDQMNTHSYMVNELDYNRLFLIGSLLMLPIKITLSFLLNFRRYQNIFKSFRRRFL